MPEGGDRCQPAQLNAYRRSAFKPDNFKEYQPFLRDLSWCATPANVPAHAQESQAALAAKKYNYLSPQWSNRPSTTVSYANHGNPFKNRHTVLYPVNNRVATQARGIFPQLTVSERMSSTYRGPGAMSTTRMISSASSFSLSSKSDVEMEADGLFKVGKFGGAVAKYSAAIAERPCDSVLMAKRCAALCHLGKYDAGLMDAQKICSFDGSAKSLMRCKAISQFIKGNDAGTVGFETSHITLLHAITPALFKQW